VNPVFNWIGVRSYSIYLFHIPVIHEVRTLVGGGMGPRKELLVVWVLSLAVVLPLSALTYRFVEEPLMSRGSTRRRAGAEPAREQARP
jgi:peptidoglycan/LPS O-acetylase OafA/YrhL